MKKLSDKWGMCLNWSDFKILIVIILVLTDMLILPVSVIAEYYKYIDENGAIVFTDDLGKVPENQRSKAEQLGEKGYQNQRDNNTVSTEIYHGENNLNKEQERGKVDALLRAKWNAMTNSLMNKDTTTALTYIASDTQAAYKEMFNALYDQLPAITATQRELNLVYIEDNVAKYKLITFENNKYYSHEVTFVKDEDGIWKILQY